MEKFVKKILENNNITSSKVVDKVVSRLLTSAKVEEIYKSISSLNNQVMDIFNKYKDSEEFKEYHLVIPNANAKNEYSYSFEISQFPNIKIKEIRSLDTLGLSFDNQTNILSGKPMIATQVELQIVFYNKKDENKNEEIKTVHFVVNADPKDLWKNIPSSKDIRYWKEDDDVYADDFLDRKIVIASKRGRSHAHEGTTRDDHFATQKLYDGWEIVAVADGAGSAKFARKGSEIATTFICDRFNNENIIKSISDLVASFYKEETPQPDIKSSIFNLLYKEVVSLYNYLNEFVSKEEISMKDLNTTLIFALVKKFEFGYVILTFGVGDCPICVVNEEKSEVKLLNKLDVGEYGGGTRFITMSEIFTNQGAFPMSHRFGIHRIENFSKLFLMTDGIYDPKFVVESKLEYWDTWKNFLLDIDGQNEDKTKVDFTNETEIKYQLLKWMDFWSKGNHDDRTLAIIY
ncbi:hypothetical protein CKY20_02315 [Capnocytophaga canis]|uniref:PPM-type phosphatase domain-containing protein n=1 Tax=Capnocytophaga canis TaxID=1848903 RepID=A0A3A1YMR0_9FLAO|nr:PP2C family serine/threonine-protein phosphatase [Capnocytophaga canis]RIY37554.1 hypothetical protein CKY20_02315 [Capnocytophaga canis]